MLTQETKNKIDQINGYIKHLNALQLRLQNLVNSVEQDKKKLTWERRDEIVKDINRQMIELMKNIGKGV